MDVNCLIARLEQEISLQKERMVSAALRCKEGVQYDDLLQPQDFPEIDTDPDFRGEEGELYGLERALVIVRAVCCSQK